MRILWGKLLWLSAVFITLISTHMVFFGGKMKKTLFPFAFFSRQLSWFRKFFFRRGNRWPNWLKSFWWFLWNRWTRRSILGSDGMMYDIVWLLPKCSWNALWMISQYFLIVVGGVFYDSLSVLWEDSWERGSQDRDSWEKDGLAKKERVIRNERAKIEHQCRLSLSEEFNNITDGQTDR